MAKVKSGQSKKVSQASKKKGASKKQIGKMAFGSGSGGKGGKPGLPSK